VILSQYAHIFLPSLQLSQNEEPTGGSLPDLLIMIDQW